MGSCLRDHYGVVVAFEAMQPGNRAAGSVADEHPQRGVALSGTGSRQVT